MLRSAFKVLLYLAVALVAAEAALVGLVTAVAAVRRRDWGPPEGDFPWEEQPEIELQSGEERLKLYPHYVELYEDMLAEIRSAEERIFIETFIWQADEWGRRFVEALAQKAREGVEVYAVFDELANLGQPASFKRFPGEINHLRFRNFSGPLHMLNPRSFHREHRKLLSVDGRVAFVGGFNIGVLYTNWRDTHLRVRGTEVREVERVFADFWNTHRRGDHPEAPEVRDRNWNPAISLLVTDPYHHSLPIKDTYFATVRKADERVYLTSAYFTPGPAMRSALKSAAKRGVDVQILIPEYSNHALIDRLARQHLGELLRTGVRIFLYKDFMLHAKTATVDGVWTTVGSSNVDALSLVWLHETNMEIYDEGLARQLERMFELDKTNAKELTLEEWEGRPLAEKVVEWGLVPLRLFG